MPTMPCSCPNVTCAVHGDCAACIAGHKGKTYCRSNPLLQGLMRTLFKLFGPFMGKNR